MAKKSNFQIAFELGAKMDPSMKKTFNNANKQLSGFGKKVGSLVKTGAKLAAGMGAAFVGIGTAAFAMTNKVTSAFDDIAKGSRKMGVSSDFYQEMDYWASQNGLSHENMEKAVGRFNQRLGMAQNGNEKYASALDKMGVSLEDVRNGTLSTEDAFAQSIQNLSEMENKQDQVALATELFGTKLARNLLPALEDGALSIDEAKKKAEELGIVISEDSLEAAEEFQDSWDDLSRIFTAFGQKVIAKMMPYFQQLMDWALENAPLIEQKISGAFDRAGEMMKLAFEKTQPVIEWMSNEGIPMARDAIQTILEKATDFYNFVKGNWSTIKPLLMGIGTAAVVLKGAVLGLAVFQSVTGFITAFRAATVAGRLAMLGLNTAMLMNPAFWIVAAFMAVIAIGIAVWQNWDTVKEWLLIIWDAIKSSVSTVGTAISNAFTSAYNWVTNLFAGIGEWFMAKFMMIVNVATMVGQGIGNAFSAAYNWIVGVFSGIGAWFSGIFSAVGNAASSVGTAIGNAFSSAYQAVTGLFSGLGSWFSGIMSSVSGAFTTGVNAVIGLANSAINSLNNISVDIPSWVPGVGGKNFGINIPNIPYLAEGGVTTGPTLAMIGEGAEQEAVLPLSKLEALLDTEPSGGSNQISVTYGDIIIEGNASKDDVRQAMALNDRDIERLIDRYLANKRRKKL